MERSEQELEPEKLALLSLFKLEGNTRLPRFNWYNSASGSLLCLCESVTTFTCNKRCDCRNVAVVNDSLLIIDFIFGVLY